MPQPTDILKQEHNAILRMLDAAEALAGRIGRGAPPEPELLAGVSEFFELFLDRCHHGKEEDLFFPLLERKGVAVRGGPIGVMLREHQQGRQLTAVMVEAARAYQHGDTKAAQRWAQAATEHAALLRDHIFKENAVLFPMADGLLAPAEQDALVARFDELETERMGAGTHERLHARMAEIFARVFGADQPRRL
jgi:hemerythrin-like domain-containing protein